MITPKGFQSFLKLFFVFGRKKNLKVASRVSPIKIRSFFGGRSSSSFS